MTAIQAFFIFEVYSIRELKFPNVTVCPPKNSVLNLNYDVVESNNKSLDKNMRESITEYAIEIIQNEFYHEIMRNMSKE